MNSHAFPLYKAGHIQSVFVQHKDTMTNIRVHMLARDEKGHPRRVTQLEQVVLAQLVQVHLVAVSTSVP